MAGMLSRSTKAALTCLLTWSVATAGFFVGEAVGLTVPPIAKEAAMNLVTAYIPIALLAVVLLLFMTRNRAVVDWEVVFCVDNAKALPRALAQVGYLLVTQCVLGIVFGIGLHFPGPDVYSNETSVNKMPSDVETPSHSQADVWTWAGVNMLTYVVLPMAWLFRCGSAFNMRKLLLSCHWKRDAWIIAAYWAIDFGGPMLFGAGEFFGLSATQYLAAVPLGILVNTLGAGLPVIVMMHMLFLPNTAVLFPKRGRGILSSKLPTIAIAGIFYAIFSLFDPGTDYTDSSAAFMSVAYIFMTQMLVGMGKAAFTVVTGNPFIHFINLHVLSARIPFDTRMYAEIFAVK
jgi:hypothetical protein